MKLLIVCSGNICRSPMAQALARRLMCELGRDDFSVRSAGTLDIEGHSASPEAIIVMQQIGLDLRNHRSRGLNNELIEWADFILVMEPDHELEVLSRAGGRRIEIVRLWEHLERAGADRISDPIGKPMEAYLDCRTDLENSLRKVLPRLLDGLI